MGEGIRLVERLQGAATVGRAFGEPVRQGDLVILPVASVRGGGGGGGGGGETADHADVARGPDGRGEGGGAGFGLRVVPCGVFVVRGERIHWKPAVNVNRIVLGGQIVALAAILTVRSLLNNRCRAGKRWR